MKQPARDTRVTETSPGFDPRNVAPALDRRRPPTPWSAHFAVVRSHPWLIVAATLLTVAVSAAYVSVAPRRYEAHAELLVSVSPTYQPALEDLGLLHVSADAGRPAQTVAWLAMTRRVAAVASARLGGHPSPGSIAAHIVAQPVAGADVVDVAATASSAATAAAIANADAYGVRTVRAADLRPTIDRLIAQLQGDVKRERQGSVAAAATSGEIQDLTALRLVGDPSVHILQTATTPSAPSWPKPQIILAGAALVGLLVGVLGAFALESRDPRLRSAGQLRRLFAAPVIATIAPARTRRLRRWRRHPIPPDQLGAAASEQIRTLSHRLVGRHCILVTGASGAEGRTTVATALAQAAAQAGRDTILVEVDLRKGALAETLDLHAYDAQDVLGGRASLRVALAHAHGLSARLRVLPAGKPLATLADLPEPGRMVDMIRNLCDLADLVIVDAPPLGTTGDSVPLVALADLALLVVRVGATRLNPLAQAIAELEGAETGTVVVG
ncbi:MAG TPA: hypothetical protein VGL44_01645, partial [Gaiellales bacterium]